MTIDVKPVSITSDDILQELVLDVLPQLLGHSYEVITNNLPYDGNHILVLGEDHRPGVISFDCRDGGRALLTGLAVIEGLVDNRALLYRLYPDLFRGQAQHSTIFRIEDTRLILLAPSPPPGGTFLGHALKFLSVYTYRALRIDDKIGLLIDPYPFQPTAAQHSRDASVHALSEGFRSDTNTLNAEEEAYFSDTFRYR